MKKSKNSVQGLIGLERFTRFGVKTDKAELAFFSVEPTNISVLSATNIDVKIHHLMMLLRTIPDLEILHWTPASVLTVIKIISGKGLKKSRTRRSENCCKLTMIFLTRYKLRCQQRGSLCLLCVSDVKRTSRYSVC